MNNKLHLQKWATSNSPRYIQGFNAEDRIYRCFESPVSPRRGKKTQKKINWKDVNEIDSNRETRRFFTRLEERK